MSFSRRQFLIGVSASLSAGGLLAACASDTNTSDDSAGTLPRSSAPSPTAVPAGWFMPAEELDHERTWMCWPSSREIWGTDLPDVQDAIIRIALAISAFEPVAMLARPEEVAALGRIFGEKVELIEAPVDDLWARDTLPAFLTRKDGEGSWELAAGVIQFNGWGDKQTHDGDAQLAELVADHLDVPVVDSGLTGEGGGLEIDGVGSVLAAESSWVNENRNPAMSRGEIEEALLSLLGADRMIWVDGLAGADITDGHIDTLARFASGSVILVDKPAFDDADDPWVAVAARTKEQVTDARTADGSPYEVVEIVQPATPRGSGASFLGTYMNYYVCNGAVIAPEFGDAQADAAAKGVLAELFPDREIVQLDIDALAAGGGGIHCATQQQPALI